MNILRVLRGQNINAACAALALIVGMGCASGPPSQLKAQIIATDTSIVQAEQAGAAQAALPELQQAKDKRARAEAAMNDKEYDDALRLALQAQVDAQFASRKSEAVRAARTAAEVEQSTDTLERETERKLETPEPTDTKRLSVDR
jgi:hypothetical protein